MATVATFDTAISAEAPTDAPANETTEDTFRLPTVDRFIPLPSEALPHQPSPDLTNSRPQPISAATLDDQPPVAVLPHPVLPPQIANLALWLTEAGEVVPASRVKRIRFAQDVLNSAEESVYDTLWAAKSGNRSPTDRDPSRVAQAGYDFLMKRTRLSKKTIQRIVDRLIDKGFIEIHEPADIYHRTSTIYRVYSYRSVLERQSAKGRTHVAKIGPGFVYVYPYDTHSQAALPAHPSTVVMFDPPTVATSTPSTGANQSTPTVDQRNPATVVAAATLIERQLFQGTTTASETAKLREILTPEVGPIDDGAVRQLLTACRGRASDCTHDEIAYFVRLKLKWVRNLQNPVGFILTAVPHHFENGAHLSVRELLRQESEEKVRQWRETYYYWKAIADDAAQPAAERAEARLVLESLDGPPGMGPISR